MPRLRQLVREIHRHSLWQVLLLYVGGSWAVIEAADLFTERFGLPDWVFSGALILLGIGVVLVVAMAFFADHAGPQALEDAGAGAAETRGADAFEVVPEGARRELGFWHRLLTWRPALVGGIVAFSILLGLGGLYVIIQERFRSTVTEPGSTVVAAPAVAVLPFDISGPDLETWREGLVTLLSINLDGAGGLRAIDSRTVLARWDASVGTGEGADRETSLQVAQSSGARYALLGSAVALGPRVRMAADVHEVDEGQALGQVQVEGPPDSVLALVDRLTAGVIGIIYREAGSGELPTLNLAAITTTSIPALKAYLAGEVQFRHGDFDRAYQEYEQAVAEDSTFALAHKRLGECLGWLEHLGSTRAVEYTERAEQFAQKLPEREALLLRASLALERWDLNALELTREATLKYPDDAEAWYLLGETYYHLGERLLIGLDESEAPYQRAVDLDPRFVPYRLHPIHLAFSHHADSLRASQLIEEFSAVAPGTPYDHVNRLAFRLAFAGSQSDDAIAAALDSVEDVFRLVALWDYLAHPRFSEVKEKFLYRYRYGDPAYEPRRPWVLFLNSAFTRGQLRRGLEQLDDPIADNGLRLRSVYMAYTTGMPVPAERLDTLLELSEEDSGATWVTLDSGAYAADRGRWDEYASLLGLLNDASEAARAEGDSADAAFWEMQARMLDGYGLWKRGRPREALAVLAAVPPEYASDLYRWWLGLLYLEMDRPRDAVRYFRTFRLLNPQAHAHYYLGQAYERLGEYDKALRTYAFFVNAWEDADPELQAWVDAARRSMEALSSER